jgi:hypothetical protein
MVLQIGEAIVLQEIAHARVKWDSFNRAHGYQASNSLIHGIIVLQKNRRFYPLWSPVLYLLAPRTSAFNCCVMALPTSRHTAPGSPRRRSYTIRKVKLRVRTLSCFPP